MCLFVIRFSCRVREHGALCRGVRVGLSRGVLWEFERRVC